MVNNIINNPMQSSNTLPQNNDTQQNPPSSNALIPSPYDVLVTYPEGHDESITQTTTPQITQETARRVFSALERTPPGNAIGSNPCLNQISNIHIQSEENPLINRLNEIRDEFRSPNSPADQPDLISEVFDIFEDLGEENLDLGEENPVRANFWLNVARDRPRSQLGTFFFVGMPLDLAVQVQGEIRRTFGNAVQSVPGSLSESSELIDLINTNRPNEDTSPDTHENTLQNSRNHLALLVDLINTNRPNEDTSSGTHGNTLQNLRNRLANTLQNLRSSGVSSLTTASGASLRRGIDNSIHAWGWGIGHTFTNPGHQQGQAQVTFSSALQHFTDHVADTKLKNFDYSPLKPLEESLKIWLSKLKDNAEFTNENIRPYFCHRILSILQFAVQNEEFLQSLKQDLGEATEACTDRALYVANQMEVLERVMKAPDEDRLKVLKGAYTVKLVEKFAVKKVAYLQASSCSVDATETLLGFQVKLRETLDLPMSCTSMTFPSWSNITQLDLEEAEYFVKSESENVDAFADYLVDQKVWVRKVEKDYAQERKKYLEEITLKMGALDKKKDTMKEKKYLTKCTNLKKKYEKAEADWLKAKTLEILQSTQK